MDEGGAKVQIEWLTAAGFDAVFDKLKSSVDSPFQVVLRVGFLHIAQVHVLGPMEPS